MKGKSPCFYGSRCDKYDLDTKKPATTKALPDLFAEREDWLVGRPEDLQSRRKTRENRHTPDHVFPGTDALLPDLFYRASGLKWSSPDPTNKSIIHRGVEVMAAETCLPIKVAHGHILELIQQGVDRIFLPSIVDLKANNPEHRPRGGLPLCPDPGLHGPVHHQPRRPGGPGHSTGPLFRSGGKGLEKGLDDPGPCLGHQPLFDFQGPGKGLGRPGSLLSKQLQPREGSPGPPGAGGNRHGGGQPALQRI